MLRACEPYTEGIPVCEINYSFPDCYKLPISFKDLRDEFYSTQYWTRFVEGFGRCSITMPHDRLIAIAGVAKSLQPILHDEYLAGLWKSDIPYNLTWTLANVEGEVVLL